MSWSPLGCDFVTLLISFDSPLESFYSFGYLDSMTVFRLQSAKLLTELLRAYSFKLHVLNYEKGRFLKTESISSRECES